MLHRLAVSDPAGPATGSAGQVMNGLAAAAALVSLPTVLSAVWLEAILHGRFVVPGTRWHGRPSADPDGDGGPVVVAVGKTVILLHPPLPLVGVSIETMRECQQNDSVSPTARWLARSRRSAGLRSSSRRGTPPSACWSTLCYCLRPTAAAPAGAWPGAGAARAERTGCGLRCIACRAGGSMGQQHRKERRAFLL